MRLVICLICAALLSVAPAHAGWVDPAFTNSGGPPTPPAPGQPLPGGRFPDHGVIPFGDAHEATTQAAGVNAPVVSMAADPRGAGYWMVAADGDVIGYGGASAYGSAVASGFHAPFAGIAATPDGLGYWLVDVNGTVFAFGDALQYGSMAGHALPAPVVGMAASPTGLGYWVVAADGSVFGFGDAQSHGSMGGRNLYAPIVGMAATPSGHGYWEVASDGGIFGFGDAAYYGSMGGKTVNGSVIGIARTRDGRGYWIGADDGAVYSFGDAPFYGSNATEVPTPAIAAIVATPDGRGYWLLDPATVHTDFSVPGAASGSAAAAIVGGAATQLGGNPSPGYFCNPYGPCEEWCALFATWAWQQAGIPIPRYAFTGDVYTWAQHHTGVLPPSARPDPGDLVLYGTGPQSTNTSFHVGVVAQVWPDGAIVTLDGDAGPGPPGSGNVVINGPFLPAWTTKYNGMPIYGYAVP